MAATAEFFRRQRGMSTRKIDDKKIIGWWEKKKAAIATT